jgi:hypothetical protein
MSTFSINILYKLTSSVRQVVLNTTLKKARIKTGPRLCIFHPAPKKTPSSTSNLKFMRTDYFIDIDIISSPEGSTEYWVQGNKIFNKEGYTSFYLNGESIFGGNGDTRYYFEENILYGPENKMPWQEDVLG